MKTKKPRKVSVSSLHKKLWPVFSQYIRLKESYDGWGQCITCSIKKPWKDLQAGHFVSRRFKATLYEEMNVHTQCFACNCMLSGNLLIYRRVMDDIYSPKAVEELERRAKQVKKFTVGELGVMLDGYTAKVKELVS